MKRGFKNVLVIFYIVMLPITFGLLAGCGNSGSDDSIIFDITLTLQNDDGQQVTTFTQGESITFVLSIRNLTNSTQTIIFPSSQGYDFIVYESDGESILWQWSFDKDFLTVITELNINSNETIAFSEIWDQKNNNDVLVEAGNYKAQGLIPVNISENSSSLIDFIIQ